MGAKKRNKQSSQSTARAGKKATAGKASIGTLEGATHFSEAQAVPESAPVPEISVEEEVDQAVVPGGELPSSLEAEAPTHSAADDFQSLDAGDPVEDAGPPAPEVLDSREPEEFVEGDEPALKLLPSDNGDDWPDEESDPRTGASRPRDDEAMTRLEPSPDMVPRRQQEGLKVRVIGGGQSRQPSDIPAARRGSGVEMGFQIGGGSGGSRPQSGHLAMEDEQEEVVLRLEGGQQDDPLARSRSIEEAQTDAAPETMPRSPSRRRGKLTSLQRWTIGMAIGTTVLVILIAMASHYLPKEKQDEALHEYEVAKLEPIDHSEHAEFVRDLPALGAESVASLRRYVAAQNAEDALKEIRNANRVRDRFVARWKPWQDPPFDRSTTFDSPSIVQFGERSSLVLEGHRGDFTPFAEYFVREDGRMTLDWEATNGISEIDIARLPSTALSAPVTVRAIAKNDTYFSKDFPESDYSCFILQDIDREHVVWGYVPLKSPLDDKMRSLLNLHSYVLESSSESAAMLRIERKNGLSGNQFLILELLQPGWISQ